MLKEHYEIWKICQFQILGEAFSRKRVLKLIGNTPNFAYKTDNFIVRVFLGRKIFVMANTRCNNTLEN